MTSFAGVGIYSFACNIHVMPGVCHCVAHIINE